MLPDIELLTEIKGQIEITPCYECGTSLIFKSIEFDEEAVVTYTSFTNFHR